MKYREFYRTDSLNTALTLLQDASKAGICVAGGTDIVVKARGRDWYKENSLIDISQINELKQIIETNDYIELGALVTPSMIIDSKLCREFADILVLACQSLGGPQIRNRATIGGNIANACLAADSIPALSVLAASVVVKSMHTEREVPIDEFVIPCKACLTHQEMSVKSCFYGNPSGKKNVLKPEEMIIAVKIPKRFSKYKGSFQKIGRREALCMSQFTLAVLAKLEDQRVKDIRFTIGAALASFYMQKELCSKLIGDKPSSNTIKTVAEQLSDEILQQGTQNASIKYKAMVCKRLLERTFREILLGEKEKYDQ